MTGIAFLIAAEVGLKRSTPKPIRRALACEQPAADCVGSNSNRSNFYSLTPICRRLPFTDLLGADAVPRNCMRP